jgi:hypothetical protein
LAAFFEQLTQVVWAASFLFVVFLDTSFSYEIYPSFKLDGFSESISVAAIKIYPTVGL